MGVSVGGRMRSRPLRRNGRYVGGCTLAGGAVVGRTLDGEGVEGFDADVERAGVDAGVSVLLKISASCRRALS